LGQNKWNQFFGNNKAVAQQEGVLQQAQAQVQAQEQGQEQEEQAVVAEVADQYIHSCTNYID
jgi:hypothetical protein